ncbi:MAG: hypothetical protein HFE45_11460 [Oscillospiraceae bacterium]|jgi:hypothetical protein|nr:hypothetical protein [Oscillospiraceae bacterium]
MLEIICRDGVFFVKGSFSLGYAGTHVNEDFDSEGMVSIESSLDEVLEDFRRPRPYFWGELKGRLAPGEEDGGVIAREMAAYYCEKEAALQRHIRLFNGNLLLKLFEDLSMTGYPYWEIPESISEAAKNCTEEEFEAVYQKADDEVFKLGRSLYQTPNDGSVEKPDVEAILRKLFWTFNFDGLIASIEPEGVTLEGDNISFQCSDGWGAQLLECAYDRLDERFAFREWHNH